MDEDEKTDVEIRREKTEKEIIKRLREILKMSIASLLPQHVAFLKARQSYLTEDQVKIYSKVWDSKEFEKAKDVVHQEQTAARNAPSVVDPLTQARKDDNDQAIREQLEVILRKRIDSLTEDEVKFLRARQSYLQQNELETYKELLEVKEVKESKNDGEKTEFQKLKEEAESLGIKVSFGTSTEKLKELVENVKKSQTK